jgi:branched-chain amino acid transport system permease protein
MVRIQHNSTGHWAIRAVWVAAVAFFVLWIPTKTAAGTISDITLAYELVIAGIALNLLFGFTGVISIGHSAFFGIGGYTTAILVTRYGWSPGWTLYIAAVTAFVIGCVVSLPALRLKGLYLALVTLSIAVLFPQVIKWNKLSWLTGGAGGLSGVRYDTIPQWPLFPEIKPDREGRAVFAYWLAFLVLVIVYLVARGIVKSRIGRSLVAIRDNEPAAAVMGVNLARTKTLVFGISAAMCALAGAVSTLRITTIGPDFSYLTLIGSIVFLLIVVLGGAGTLWGPVLGGILFVLVDSRTRKAGQADEGLLSWLFGWYNGSPAQLILAVVLIALMFVAPYGLVGFLRKESRRFVLLVPKAAGTASLAPVARADDSGESAPADG